MLSSHERARFLSQAPLNWDVTNIFMPGVYEILDSHHNISYYGETENLNARLKFHYDSLKRQNHHNVGLQKASLTLPVSNFKFKVLHVGEEWADSSLRLAQQDAYIARNASRCYNILDSNQERVNKPLMYKGQRFISTRKCYVLHNISRAHLKRQLADPNVVDVYYIVKDQTPYGCIPIFAQKGTSPSVLFQSYKLCIEAGFATSTQYARRRIQNNYPGWRYAQVDDEGKPVRTPYKLKPGEISYEMWLDQLK